jgi:hypothetical protein
MLVASVWGCVITLCELSTAMVTALNPRHSVKAIAEKKSVLFIGNLHQLFSYGGETSPGASP